MNARRASWVPAVLAEATADHVLDRGGANSDGFDLDLGDLGLAAGTIVPLLIAVAALAAAALAAALAPEDVPWSSSSAMPNPSAVARVATSAPRPQCAEARRSGLGSC